MDISSYIEERTKSRVASGLFRGMRLSPRVCWSSLDRASKLLGTYEQELHGVIRDMALYHHDGVIDIGCAEGYYAIGLGLVFETAQVVAYDTNEVAHDICRENARLNGIDDRVSLKRWCDPDELVLQCSMLSSPLIFCDCEGYETELFGEVETRNALRHADIIIECHDFLKANCTETIRDWFTGTHDVYEYRAGARDPSAFAMLANVSDVNRWLAVCEHRPCVMSWVVCRRSDRKSAL